MEYVHVLEKNNLEEPFAAIDALSDSVSSFNTEKGRVMMQEMIMDEQKKEDKKQWDEY